MSFGLSNIELSIELILPHPIPCISPPPPSLQLTDAASSLMQALRDTMSQVAGGGGGVSGGMSAGGGAGGLSRSISPATLETSAELAAHRIACLARLVSKAGKPLKASGIATAVAPSSSLSMSPDASPTSSAASSHQPSSLLSSPGIKVALLGAMEVRYNISFHVM